MDSKLSRLDEGVTTQFTFMKTFSSVRPHVKWKVLLDSKTFLTLMAGERLLSGMTLVMSGKCCCHFGRLAASITFIKGNGACGGGGGAVFGLHVELVLGELLG